MTGTEEEKVRKTIVHEARTHWAESSESVLLEVKRIADASLASGQLSNSESRLVGITLELLEVVLRTAAKSRLDEFLDPDVREIRTAGAVLPSLTLGFVIGSYAGIPVVCRILHALRERAKQSNAGKGRAEQRRAEAQPNSEHAKALMTEIRREFPHYSRSKVARETAARWKRETEAFSDKWLTEILKALEENGTVPRAIRGERG